MIMALKSP